MVPYDSWRVFMKRLHVASFSILPLSDTKARECRCNCEEYGHICKIAPWTHSRGRLDQIYQDRFDIEQHKPSSEPKENQARITLWCSTIFMQEPLWFKLERLVIVICIVEHVPFMYQIRYQIS